MNHQDNEKGIALVTALLLTLIGLVVVVTTIYFITQGTRLSGLNKRYQTALEASHGAVEIISKEVIPRRITTQVANLSGLGYGTFMPSYDDACFATKLLNPPTAWGSCDKTLSPKSSPDIMFSFKGVPPQADFNVYVKIVDTVQGNSDLSGMNLIGHGVVDPGVINPQPFPNLYRMEVQGERKNNPDEQASLSVLYAY